MMKGWTSICSHGARLRLDAKVRFMGTSSLIRTEERNRRSSLFDEEKRRQKIAVGRIDKIKVKYTTYDENVTLLMNKNISTPYDCARHISEGMAKMSALAQVNGVPWDMHKPLVEDCDMKLLTMRTPGNITVNVAFWRTCSLILGSVIESAFKDEIKVYPYSFIAPNLRSGNFVYDAQIDLDDWKPTSAELKCISALFAKVVHASLPVERLEVGPREALNIFRDNPHKSKQIPDISRNNENRIILYRIGDYVDISKGPAIGNTGIVGRCTVAAVHKIRNEHGESLYRFQGVALPSGILVNHFVYGILEERARKLNNACWMPYRINEENDEHLTMAAKN